MTTPGSGPHGDRPRATSGGQGIDGPSPDPERVLSQALRAMAGGEKQVRPDTQSGSAPAQRAGGQPKPSLSLLQIILIATIFGLLVGITVGLVTLLA